MRLNLSVLALAAAAFLGLASVSEAGIWTKQTPMQTVAPPTVTAETLASFTANKLGSTCPHTGAYIAPNEALWFTQLADHFAHDSTATWQQKYYMNDAYAAASSPESPPPVHVYIGSEGPLSPNYLMSGLVHDAAKAHSARMVALEHRFYGDSKPTADLSPASLRLLSSQQALADLAAFLTAMGYTDRSKNGPITVWGGSYGGSLSAWFRLKYPHIAIASLASSAPLEPEVAFYQYYEVVEDALTEFGGATCVSNIRKALVTVEQKLQGGDAAALADDFLLCTAPPSGTSPARADVLARETFFYSLTDRVADIIQYHKDAAAQNIVTLCKDLATQASPYAGLASSMREWLRLRGSKCIDHSYADMVASMNSTRWGNGMMRQWTWQTCTEFGFYQVRILFVFIAELTELELDHVNICIFLLIFIGFTLILFCTVVTHSTSLSHQSLAFLRFSLLCCCCC